MIKILLADDHAMVRAGLRRLLEETGLIEVVAEAADGPGTLAEARQHRPDVAVVDISMPGMDGLEVLVELLAERPSMPVLVLSMHEEEQYIVRAIKAGAKGYLTKHSAPEQLVTAIRTVYEGGRFLTDQAAEAVAISMGSGAANRSLLDGLSDREIQVLRRLALGQTNREIATAYGISVKTVDTYRLRLLKKLKLRNNTELSRFALRNKLVKL